MDALTEASVRIGRGDLFTPVPRPAYRVGVPQGGRYLEVFNSDSEAFGGSNLGKRLTAPHVAGLRAHHGDLIPATWMPILSRDTWDRLVSLRADPSRRTRAGAPARMLLTGGIARCG